MDPLECDVGAEGFTGQQVHHGWSVDVKHLLVVPSVASPGVSSDVFLIFLQL